MTQGGGGGHTSEPEKPSYKQKEPENDPIRNRSVPKGVRMHTQNAYPRPATQKALMTTYRS